MTYSYNIIEPKQKHSRNYKMKRVSVLSSMIANFIHFSNMFRVIFLLSYHIDTYPLSASCSDKLPPCYRQVKF